MLTETTARILSTITYPLRHQFAHIAPDPTGQDSDLNTYDHNAHILVTGAAERVFNSQEPGFNVDDLVGRIVRVRPSRPTSEQWYMQEEDNPNHNGGAYLRGARVNPPLVNGRVYQELRATTGVHVSSPFTVRYNDEFHLEDRADRALPFTIVWAGRGLERSIGQARVEHPSAWVEVEFPLVPFSPVTTGLATDEDIELILTGDENENPVPQTPAPVQYITNSEIGHTLGKAHIETEGEHSGRVILDPVRVEGEAYLTWYEGREYYDDHVFVQVSSGGDGLTPIGYFNRGVNGQVYYSDDVYSTPPLPRLGATNQTMHWAKMGWDVPPAADDADVRLTAVIEEAEQAHEAFEDLNDALNVLARNQSWCSEYEANMTRIGMRHRRTGGRTPFDIDNVGTVAPVERHAWAVQYDVDVTITDDSLSYRVSNMLESEYGAANVSSLRLDATVTVTISGVVADSEEEAEEMVSRSQIEDELDGMIEGEVEMNDYTHCDTSEDTDFDWDDYDNQ